MRTAKKLIIFAPVLALLSSCATMTDLTATGVIRLGMSRAQLGEISLNQGFFDFAGDPFLGDCFYEFIPSSSCEILSGRNRKQFYVFCGVDRSTSCFSRGGSQTLRGIFDTYENAKSSLIPRQAPREQSVPYSSPAPSSTPKAKEKGVDIANRCLRRGLKPGTTEFARCVDES